MDPPAFDRLWADGSPVQAALTNSANGAPDWTCPRPAPALGAFFDRLWQKAELSAPIPVGADDATLEARVIETFSAARDLAASR